MCMCDGLHLRLACAITLYHMCGELLTYAKFLVAAITTTICKQLV